MENTALVLRFPETVRPKPRLAQSSPELMMVDAPYSLLDDIRQQQMQPVTTKEKVALYHFPCYVSLNVRRVLARNRAGRTDWALALSCLLWRGLCRYSSLPAAQDLSAALTDLDTDDTLDSVASEQVEIWRRGFRFQLTDPTHTMGLERTRSFRSPEHIHTELYDLAGKLGMHGAALGAVSIMAGLHDQEGVIAQHAAFMRDTIASLDTLLLERGRRLQGLVRSIAAGVWR